MAYEILICTDGQAIELPSDVAGMATGYGFIGNPYFFGDADWRWKDGDTVIECEADNVLAMPVADAYQEWQRRSDDEQEMFEIEQDKWDRLEDEWRQERAENAYWAPIEALYEIQDELCS